MDELRKVGKGEYYNVNAGSIEVTKNKPKKEEAGAHVLGIFKDYVGSPQLSVNSMGISEKKEYAQKLLNIKTASDTIKEKFDNKIKNIGWFRGLFINKKKMAEKQNRFNSKHEELSLKINQEIENLKKLNNKEINSVFELHEISQVSDQFKGGSLVKKTNRLVSTSKEFANLGGQLNKKVSGNDEEIKSQPMKEYNGISASNNNKIMFGDLEKNPMNALNYLEGALNKDLKTKTGEEKVKSLISTLKEFFEDNMGFVNNFIINLSKEMNGKSSGSLDTLQKAPDWDGQILTDCKKIAKSLHEKVPKNALTKWIGGIDKKIDAIRQLAQEGSPLHELTGKCDELIKILEVKPFQETTATNKLIEILKFCFYAVDQYNGKK